MRHIHFLALLVFALSASMPAQPNPALFAPVVMYGPGLHANSVAVADVNLDGKPDIIVGGDAGGFNSGTVAVLLGNGDGTFQTPVTYSSGGSFPMVAVADVNLDGRPDIVVANSYVNQPIGSVRVLLGNGDGTFQPTDAFYTPLLTGMALADLNGDGKPDLMLSIVEMGIVQILLGNGDGTFQWVSDYDSGGIRALSVRVADVNGDGKPDILVPNGCASVSNCVNGTVGVLLGKGDGTFQAAAPYSSGGVWPTSLALADVNQDGKPDLLVTNYSSHTVDVLLGNGDGTFQSAVTYSSGGLNPTSVAVADVNGDGMPDLITANYCSSSGDCTNGVLGVLLGNGDGSFQAALPFGSGGIYPVSVAAADVNADGKPDIEVANYYANNSNWENGSLGLLLNITPSPYKAFVRQPIKPDGTSIFKATRGVVPVKFTLTKNDVPTCVLPDAKITVARGADGAGSPLDEGTYMASADRGSNFRVDLDSCQYVYNLAASALGVGVYSVDIKIYGWVAGNAVFSLR